VSLQHSRIHATDCAECETKDGHIDRIDREIALGGPLDDEQRARLLEIADRCPVHRTLTSEINIRTRLAQGAPPAS
jgi:putative redox protein